jgi:hypothetical protein
MPAQNLEGPVTVGFADGSIICSPLFRAAAYHTASNVKVLLNRQHRHCYTEQQQLQLT